MPVAERTSTPPIIDEQQKQSLISQKWNEKVWLCKLGF